MDARFTRPLLRANRGESWLVLLPTLILALPATPYLAWPVIMWLKAPWMLDQHRLWRSELLLAGLLGCAVLSVAVSGWAARVGYLHLLKVLRTTDVLLFAMLYDGEQVVLQPPAQVSIELALGPVKPAGLGSFAHRMVRFASHCDHWCAVLRLFYEPRSIRLVVIASWLVLSLTAAAVLVLLALPGDTPLVNYIWPLLPYCLAMQHAINCGMRIAARRALATFLETD